MRRNHRIASPPPLPQPRRIPFPAAVLINWFAPDEEFGGHVARSSFGSVLPGQVGGAA